MRYLVDTDWVAEYLKGRERAVQLLTSLARDGLAISLITFGEIYEGIYFGHDPQAHERGFREFLRVVQVLPLNRSVMQRFSRVRGELRRHGQLIGDFDLLIAATALHHGLSVITNDQRHFSRVDGLRLYPSDGIGNSPRGGTIAAPPN
ncbi:MAG: type II toxin-antitoxin system VapC family toxin [Chloroflexota bacterium]